MGEDAVIYKFHRGKISAAEAIRRILSTTLGNYWFWAFPLRFLSDEQAFTVPEALTDKPWDFVILNETGEIDQEELQRAQERQLQWRTEFLHKNYRKLLEWHVIVNGWENFYDEAAVFIVQYDQDIRPQYKLLWLLDLEEGRRSLMGYCKTNRFEPLADVSYLGVRFMGAKSEEHSHYQVVFFANYDQQEQLESLISLRLFKEKANIRRHDVDSLRPYISDLVSVLWPVWQSIPGARKTKWEIKSIKEKLSLNYKALDHRVRNLLLDAADYLAQCGDDPIAQDLEQDCRSHAGQIELAQRGEFTLIGAGVYSPEHVISIITKIAESQRRRKMNQIALPDCFELQVKLETPLDLSHEEFAALNEAWAEMLSNAFKFSRSQIISQNKITVKIEYAAGLLETYVRNPGEGSSERNNSGRTGGIEIVATRITDVFGKGNCFVHRPLLVPPDVSETGLAYWVWSFGVRPRGSNR